MGVLVRIVAGTAAALFVSGCDPVIESNQTGLLNQYIDTVCAQASPNCGGDWTRFVQVGMKDIDLRCDGFLAWLDTRRGNNEPSLADLAAVTAPVHPVSTVTGASPKSLDTAAEAFRPAAAARANWNSQRLMAVNRATIQDIVYTSQGKFRNKIKHYRVSNQRTAVYLLRNYLRLCLPTTIEASINRTTSPVQRTTAPAVQDTDPARENAVSQRLSTGTVLRSKFLPDDTSAVLEKYLDPDGTGMQPDRIRATTPFLTKNGLRVRDLPRFLNGAEFAAKRKDLVRELLAQGQ